MIRSFFQTNVGNFICYRICVGHSAPNSLFYMHDVGHYKTLHVSRGLVHVRAEHDIVFQIVSQEVGHRTTEHDR